MDFLKQLRKTAQNAAKEGLEWLGVNIPQHEIPDDEDTATRDLIDIYREISQRDRNIDSPQLSPALRQEMHDFAAPFCGNHAILLESIDAWLADCHNVLPEAIRTETIAKLQQGGVIRSLGDNSDQWLENIQEIAKAQQRTVFNLLLQTHKQCPKDDFDTWLNDMNDRLSMFDLRIDKVGTQKMTLISC